MSIALDPSAVKAPDVERARRDPLTPFFLAAAVLLAGLPFLGLGRWGLWLDEALTLADCGTPWDHVNPIGYWVFARFYDWAPGRPDEFWLRFPGALFGCASVLATLWALRPFVGARASALGAFFLSASVWHLYWSQNARFYSLAQLLALLGAGALLRGLVGSSFARTALGLALLALAALTHPSAALLAAPLLVVVWIARWLDWIPGEPAHTSSWSLLGWAGWIVLVLGSGWAVLSWNIWNARQGRGSPLHFVQTSGYLVTPTLGLAAGLGAWRHWRRRATFVPVATVVLALLGALVASFFVRVSAQYVFVAQPWIALCAGLAFVPPPGSEEPARTRRWRGLLALGVALPGLVEAGLYFGLRNGDRPPWREAYAYVFEHRAPTDLVLGMEAPVAEYYLNPGSRTLRDWTAVTWLDDFRSRLAQDWARYERRTWFVVNPTLLDDWTGQQFSAENRAEFERILRDECVLAARFDVPWTPRDLDVLVYVTQQP